MLTVSVCVFSEVGDTLYIEDIVMVNGDAGLLAQRIKNLCDKNRLALLEGMETEEEDK